MSKVLKILIKSDKKEENIATNHKSKKPAVLPGLFSEQGSFIEILGHLDKHSPTTQEWKAPQGKIIWFFDWKLLKNFILNEKFYLLMTTIRTSFLQIRALFFNFWKRAGETSPSLPCSLPLVTCLKTEKKC